MKRLLILGGGGFIGGALASRFCEDHEVVIADACDFQKSSLQFTCLLTHANVRLIRMDATDEQAVLALGDDFDYIVHAVAILGIHKVVERSILTITTNYASCLAALHLAERQKHLKKFITFSTSEVYGRDVETAAEAMDMRIGPANEPRWCYAASKVLCEHLVNAYCRERNVPTTIIRPFNVFGENRLGSNAMSKFVAQALLHDRIVIDGSGEQLRAWCYIGDFIDGLSRALLSDYRGEFFNIGNPNNIISIKALAEKIVAMTGSRSEIVVSNSQEPDVVRRTVCVDKAHEMLGYTPRIGLDEGISHVVDWMRTLDEPMLRSFVG